MSCAVWGSNPGKVAAVFSTDVQAVTEVHPASYLMGTGFFLGGGRGLKRPGLKLATHLHLVLWLRMKGAIPLLLLYAIIH